jgi:hypothetical protein
MRAVPLPLTLVMLTLGLTSARSQESDINTNEGLYEICSGRWGTIEHSWCGGYLTGLAEALGGEDIVCLPPNVHIAALIQTYVNWARNHPEEWGNDAAVGVKHALEATFPCH